MGQARNGQEFPCFHCGKLVYRRASQIKRGINKTCGAPDCKSVYFRGANNPFYGKIHNEETRAKIKAGRKANPPKRCGVSKGYRHSPEARAAMSLAQKKNWAENRDRRLANLPRGSDNHMYKTPDERRYRKNFTPLQRREWKDEKCAWCDTTENLNLDHIIPIFDGGLNERRNAQTLCHPCNLWKSNYVDRPRFNARLGSEGGQS